MTLLEIRKKVWGRAGQNIFGWGIFTGLWIYNVPVGHAYAPAWYWFFRFIIFGLVIGLCYFNNLFLIPKLFVKKRYIVYVLLILFFSFLDGFCFNVTLKLMHQYFPKIEIGEVSFIMTDIPAGWSAGALWSGAQNHFFFIIEFVTILMMAWYIRSFTMQQKQIEEARQKQVETELHFLKSQINPHFLFNTLNNIYGLALKKNDSSPEAILQLSTILRYLLYESNEQLVPFDKEKKMAEAYIGLELLRLQKPDHFQVSIAADKTYNIPPLLWLPVLENIFKHGTRVIADSYYIEYRFEIKDNILNIYSKNNFKANGNGDLHEEKGKGIGLENLRKRLQLLYPANHSIETWSEGSFFITDVKINLA